MSVGTVVCGRSGTRGMSRLNGLTEVILELANRGSLSQWVHSQS